MAETIEDKIEENAKELKKVTVDGQISENHPLPDQIAADKYISGKTAASGTGLGIKFNKIVPPGSI